MQQMSQFQSQSLSHMHRNCNYVIDSGKRFWNFAGNTKAAYYLTKRFSFQKQDLLLHDDVEAAPSHEEFLA